MGQEKYIAKAEVKKLSGRSDVIGLLLVAHCWGVILAAAALYIIFPNPFTLILALVIIGGRQLGMAILMHDTAHGILFKSPKLNKYIGQYLLAYPIGIDLPTYRKYHLKHHLYTQQEQDPDLALSAAFPVTKASFVRKTLRDLTGLTAIKLRGGQLIIALKSNQKTFAPNDQAFNVTSILGPYTVNFIGFGLCYLGGIWWAYFLLWLLPLFTTFQLFLRIRNIAEHAMTPEGKNVLQTARTTRANIFARICVAPYWVNYHVEHHAYMYIPCWQLKNTHSAMRRNGHTHDMNIKESYWDVLKMATSK
jgi:fatty acid desaturase